MESTSRHNLVGKTNMTGIFISPQIQRPRIKPSVCAFISDLLWATTIGLFMTSNVLVLDTRIAFRFTLFLFGFRSNSFGFLESALLVWLFVVDQLNWLNICICGGPIVKELVPAFTTMIVFLVPTTQFRQVASNWISCKSTVHTSQRSIFDFCMWLPLFMASQKCPSFSTLLFCANFESVSKLVLLPTPNSITPPHLGIHEKMCSKMTELFFLETA